MSRPLSPIELLALANTDVTECLPKEAVVQAQRSPPFVHVPGTFNTRDIGLVPLSSGNTGSRGPMRPGFAYRSGDLSRLSDDGKTMLAGKLGVKKIFDLRSLKEHENAPDPHVPDVENVWTRSEEPPAPLELQDFVDGEGERGYEIMYLDILRVYKPSFRVILEHVRDCPLEPFLFHCTGTFMFRTPPISIVVFYLLLLLFLLLLP
jgi:hypothetical protein